MAKHKETFSSLLLSFEHHFDLRTVFEDFLTMSMCAVTPKLGTGKSHYEDLYMQTVAKYANHHFRFQFPTMFALLVSEMTERLERKECCDILGEFYEQHISSRGKGQFFTPWHICEFMAKSSADAAMGKERLNILEPACGSGRMLLAMMKEVGPWHNYYAVDIDPLCCKMTALNLFLNGMFYSEVMCGNFLFPDQFSVSYKLSMLPIGIFRIEDKQQSPLYHMIKHQPPSKNPNADEKVNGDLFSEDNKQLRIF